MKAPSSQGGFFSTQIAASSWSSAGADTQITYMFTSQLCLAFYTFETTLEVEFPWISPCSRGKQSYPCSVLCYFAFFVVVWGLEGCPAQTRAWGRKRKLSPICHFSMTFALVDACTSNQPVAQSGVSLAIRIPNLYRKILRKMSTKCVSWIKNCLSYLDSRQLRSAE
jgi:hypothetical protein